MHNPYSYLTEIWSFSMACIGHHRPHNKLFFFVLPQ